MTCSVNVFLDEMSGYVFIEDTFLESGFVVSEVFMPKIVYVFTLLPTPCLTLA